MIEDIYSRKIVGYEVHENECGVKAATLLERTCWREKKGKHPLVLHSDNGVTMKVKMEELGITPSYNRPRVSNDNPFSESTFRTLKYRPNWLSHGFKDLAEVRDWVQEFVEWYNNDHKHSRIKFVTPSQRHDGIDREILAKKQEVLRLAKAKNPLRWSREIRRFMTGPIACEVTGLTFSPDYKTMFIGIQHPGEELEPSHWPDSGNSTPRSSIMMITKKDGSVIGS